MHSIQETSKLPDTHKDDTLVHSEGLIRNLAKYLIRLSKKLGAESVSLSISQLARWLAFNAHKIQHVVQFGAEPKPEWFDHNIDLFHGWPNTGNPDVWERGIYNLMALRPNGKVLDLCCGDGFYSRFFYATKVKSILAIDFSDSAIRHANKLYSHEKIKFVTGDVTRDIPIEKFDNVVWDSAMCLFSDEQVKDVLVNLKSRLGTDGILSGHIGYEPDQYQLTKTSYKSISDIEKRLSPHFDNVRVFSTQYQNRLNLYFFASDGDLPFDKNWTNSMQVKNARNH